MPEQQTTEAYNVDRHVSDLLGSDVSTPESTATEPVAEPTADAAPQIDVIPKPESGGELAGSTDATEFNPVIEQMRSTFAQQGIEVEIPDDFKGTEVPADKVYNFINETLNKKIQTEDPFINQYLEAKNKGLDYNQFIEQKVQQQQLLDLSGKDFLTRLYKARNGKTEQNPNGYTDDAIQQHINKMSPIEVEEAASQYKTQLQENFNKAVPQSAVVTNEDALRVSNDEAHKIADKLILNMSQRQEIGGIPHTQKDIEEFNPVFKDLVEKNPQTGKPRVQELFSDDKVLYDVLYLYHKLNNGGLRKYLSQFKESYKEEILDKTGLRPKTTGGQTYTYSIPKSEDFA